VTSFYAPYLNLAVDFTLPGAEIGLDVVRAFWQSAFSRYTQSPNKRGAALPRALGSGGLRPDSPLRQGACP